MLADLDTCGATSIHGERRRRRWVGIGESLGFGIVVHVASHLFAFDPVRSGTTIDILDIAVAHLDASRTARIDNILAAGIRWVLTHVPDNSVRLYYGTGHSSRNVVAYHRISPIFA